VTAKALGGEPLTEQQVGCIRAAVFSAAGLKPENVTVIDSGINRTYIGGAPGGGTGEDEYLTAKTRWETDLKAKILGSLSYIPNLTVEVNAQLDREKFNRTRTTEPTKPVVQRTMEKSKTNVREGGGSGGGRPGYQAQNSPNTPAALSASSSKGPHDEEEESTSETVNATGVQQTEKESLGLTPELVKVAIVIPNSYFEKVWRERNPATAGQEQKAPDQAALDQSRTEESGKIQKIVAALLPQAKGVTDMTELVAVTSLQDIKPVEIPLPGIGQKMLVWLAQYWSTLGMIGVGLVSLIVLRSMVRAAPGPAETAPVHVRVAAEPEAGAGESPESVAARRLRRFSGGGPSLRDELSELVQEDPDAAANILRSWIGHVT
jgi:flagellar M-ring protein FliF